jgi:hypothetical protein
MRQAKGLGGIVRGAFATRGGSSDADGSGAPSARGKMALLGLSFLVVVGLVLVASSAFASKEVVDYFGTASGSGSLGGEFNQPRDIAVNSTGAGGVPAGTIYVAEDNNNRIQRFSPSGAFVAAWGANVLTAPLNEVQTITINATAGTYTLSLGGATTAPLAYNATSEQVQTALRGLSSVGGNNVSVSGTAPYTVTFNNTLQGTNTPQLAADDSLLTGSLAVTTTTQGSGKYEICTVASECRAGTATGGANGGNTDKNGSLNRPQSVAVDNDTGNVYVSDRENRRVNEYSAEGTFIRSFGWGVDASVAGSEYEVCPAANRCQFGIAGAGVGQIGQITTAGTVGIAVSPANGEAAVGKVFLADSQNRRVNTYNLDGTSPSSLGTAGTTAKTFGTTQPREIAVSGAGILYASNSNLEGEIERYDTVGAAFLAPITSAPPGKTETQKITFTGFLAGDTFDLTCPNGTHTATIAYATGVAGRTNILNALGSACGASGNFSASGNPPSTTITFQGAFGWTNVPTTICTNLSGSGSCSVTQEVNGAPAGAGALLAPGEAAGATAGLVVGSSGALFVLRDPGAGNTVVQEFDTPGEAVPPAAANDQHGAGAGFTTANGLGINDVTGKLYVSATTAVSGLAAGHRVYVLDNAPAPAATLDPVTSFDAHSATFSGEANPNGTRTGYHFEYVDDANFQATGFTNAAKFPLADVGLGSGTSSIDVETETPHHLVPGTTYHVRLIAKQTFTSTEAIGGPQTFTTPGSAPTFHATTTVGEEEATLRAAINPENQAVTNYHFDWGTTNTYGNSTPTGTLPAGSKPVAVEEELSGLTPGQIYHYRLVATNGTGTATGSDQTLTTTTSPQFPERAFELVSFYPSGGIPGGRILSTSESGDRVQINTQPPPGSELFPPPDSQSSGGLWRYESERTADGWNFYELGLASSLYPAGTSADGERYIFGTTSLWSEDHRLDPDNVDEGDNESLYQRQPDGSLIWINRDPRIPVGTPQAANGDVVLTSPASASMSADGRTVVFESQRQLADDDTTPNTGFNGTYRLYKWSDGELSFIGKRPDGSVPARGSVLGSSSGLSGWSSSPNSNPLTVGAVSRDGTRVVFSANRTDTGPPNSAGSIYVQTDGQPTVEAVKESGVPPLPSDQPFSPIYRGASADISRLFFTTSSRLTPDSGASATNNSGESDLYVYDLEADEVRDLTPRLDGIEGVGVGPASDDRARVRGVAANSEDGRRVYFVADAQYDVAPSPEGELPSSEGRNLYLAELDGFGDPVGLRFIATLGPTDNGVWQAYPEGKTALASPDGSVLSFGSEQPLTGQGLGGTQQLFVYDAEANTLKCASCPPDGSLPLGDVNELISYGEEDKHKWQDVANYWRWISDDGTVFFHTATPLVEADHNLVEDVYEYRAGEAHLISPGSGNATRLESIGRDGQTVFINSVDPLLPWDEEPGIPKLYAARVGGGFPNPPKLPACDFSAGACEGRGTTSPDTPSAGTAVFQGPGDASPKKVPKRCPKGKHKVRRNGKGRCVSRKGAKHRQRAAKNNRRAGR